MENRYIMNPKIAVYTTITNKKDDFQDLEHRDDCADYFCFTDEPERIKTTNYKVIKLPDTPHKDLCTGFAATLEYPNPEKNRLSRLQKYYKVMFHKIPELQGYDYVIWHDGNMKIKSSMIPLIDMLENKLMGVFQHPGRDCVYTEMDECLSWIKPRKEQKIPGKPCNFQLLLEYQRKRFKELAYPEKNGLWACGILIRKSGEELLEKMMNIWWDEVRQGSLRDQVTFPYARHKTGLELKVYPGIMVFSSFYTKYFQYHKHNCLKVPS